MQSEKNPTLSIGHQRTNTTNVKDHNKANTKNSKLSNKTDRKGQHTSVTRPLPMKLTEKPQEQKCHEDILSVQIDNTQKSTYNTKVGITEATALFDSGTMLSCISKRFYDRIHQLEPLMVIDMNTGPAIVITSASADELINLGRCRLCIKLSPKTFE